MFRGGENARKKPEKRRFEEHLKVILKIPDFF